MIPLIGEMSAKQTKGCPNSENFAPALPCKLYFVRVGNGLDRSVKLYQITRANTVRPYGLRDKPKFVILRDSEGSPIAQNKNIRNEILRLTAQNDKRADSSPNGSE